MSIIPLTMQSGSCAASKCRHRQTGQQYAVKISSRRVDCTREIQLLRVCQGHSNIVRLHEVHHDEVCYIDELARYRIRPN